MSLQLVESLYPRGELELVHIHSKRRLPLLTQVQINIGRATLIEYAQANYKKRYSLDTIGSNTGVDHIKVQCSQ